MILTFPRMARFARSVRIALLFVLPFAAVAQNATAQSAASQSATTQPDSGVHFIHGASWSAIQAQAKAENKYIFMDCFTTWCGPCRYMSTQIFPQKESGDYLNDKFISVKVQLDTTSRDAADIKAWYADAHAIMQQYHVFAFPTYLIFAPDGQIVHRFVGSVQTPAALVGNVAVSFDTTRQYYTLLHQFEQGRRDTAFLRKLTFASLDAYDQQNSVAISQAYLKSQSDLLTKPVLDILTQTVSKSSDAYFTVFTDHAAEVDKILGSGAANTFVRNIYLHEGTGIRPGENRKPDWAAIHTKIATRLPSQADELTARIKVDYYRGKKDWNNFEPAMVAYMKDYGAQVPLQELNAIAWHAFTLCEDMSCVSAILDWSKGLKESNEPAFIDTYANILYKMGHKQDAIALEQKAMDLATTADRDSYQATLTKMQKNEKTWN